MSEFRANPDFVVELEQAISWYQDRSPETALRFITAVDTTIDGICDQPGRFPWKSGRLRYARVKKFPYFIAFSVTAGIITIAAIRHTSRQNADLDD